MRPHSHCMHEHTSSHQKPTYTFANILADTHTYNMIHTYIHTYSMYCTVICAEWHECHCLGRRQNAQTLWYAVTRSFSSACHVPITLHQLWHPRGLTKSSLRLVSSCGDTAAGCGWELCRRAQGWSWCVLCLELTRGAHWNWKVVYSLLCPLYCAVHYCVLIPHTPTVHICATVALR